MKPSIIITDIEIIGDFLVRATFEDGSVREADFRKLPLEGAFKRAKTDVNFFRSIHVDAGYPTFEGDLTLDSDFLYKHSKEVKSDDLPIGASFLSRASH